LVYLYDSKNKIFSYFKIETNAYKYIPNEDDLYWANKILEGGFILHFRHAERDKWIDVYMYDALESDLHENGKNNSRYAEDDYFSEAVCLNKRGKIQAKAIGETINAINLPVGDVLSSVSCRSRQTADLAFGGYDSLHRVLVHDGPYNENMLVRLNQLVTFYSNIKLKKDTNTIISSHNGVIRCEMFENACSEKLSLEEGGFYVISNKNNRLFLEYEFNNFNDFNRVFYKRD
jgi:broad specificity phosphatase PhoE